MAHSPTSWLRSLRKAVSWHRRSLGMLCAFLAVIAAVMAARPAPDQTVSLWVAGAELPAGTTLNASNLVAVEFRSDTVPDTAARNLDDVVGQRLAGPVTRGSPITTADVVGGSLAAPGRVLVPVRLAEPGVANLLRVGQRVDLHAANTPGGPAQSVASDVRIAALPEKPGGGMADRGPESLVIVEISKGDTAAVVAAASSVTMTLR